VDEIVQDPDTADALKPWYRQFCERPCFHDEYLQTFNLPNVRLIDTDGRGVDRITAHGVIVGDTEYPLDCLIYATGFELKGPMAFFQLTADWRHEGKFAGLEMRT
jgi:cation diffusion facilitator CzcD-associated flavoprotein CzcO